MGVLDGKVAIVTGAGQGVGRGIALAMAREGAAVAIAELRVERADEVAAEIRALGREAMAARCDVRVTAEVDAFVARTAAELGGVDILVNNAMAATSGVPIEQLDDAAIDLALATGPAATLRFMRACHPHLAARSGRVINLRSASEVDAPARLSTYVAAKAAIGGITRVAAREWGRHGITVNAICPFALGESARSYFDAHPERLEHMLGTLSIPRGGDPEADIGRAAVFLAGPDASYITGCTISVDGGGHFLS